MMLPIAIFAGVFATGSCLPSPAEESIHLQWSLCDSDPDVVLEKLGKGGLQPYKVNPVTYYDSELPSHTEDGIMFRTKTKKHHNISAVKVRFPGETNQASDGVNCVWDRYGNQTYFTCEMDSPFEVKKPWSNSQVEYVHKYRQVAWDDLTPFGPYWNPKWKLMLNGYRAVFDTVEAQPHHMMEIEVKVPQAIGNEAYWSITGQLQSLGVTLCEHQEARTLRLFRLMGFPVDGNGVFEDVVTLPGSNAIGMELAQEVLASL
jgi:hypothetical protein